MEFKVGEIYTLKNVTRASSGEYLCAGAEVIVEEVEPGSYVFVKENSNKNNFIKTYVRKDNLNKLIQCNKPKQKKISESATITVSDLEFLKEAREQLDTRADLHTYRNNENTYIALRMGDSVDIYRIESVSYFEGVLNQ